MNIMPSLYTRRRVINAVGLTVSLLAMGFGLFWLIWILVETVRLGFAGLSMQVFPESTPPPQAEVGGLANLLSAHRDLTNPAHRAEVAALWGLPEVPSQPGKSAVRGELFENGGLHWWAITKESTTDPYVHSINTTLYHRRFWDAYGDIPPCPSDLPGEAELLAADRYNRKEGPTTAIPQRFGEDCGEWDEVIWHMGMWRTEEYTKAGGGKRL